MRILHRMFVCLIHLYVSFTDIISCVIICFFVRMHASFLSHHLNSLMRELRRMCAYNQCVRGASKHAARTISFSHLHLDSAINNYHNPKRHIRHFQRAADSTKECHHSKQQQCGAMCNLAETLGYNQNRSMTSNIPKRMKKHDSDINLHMNVHRGVITCLFDVIFRSITVERSTYNFWCHKAINDLILAVKLFCTC